MLGQGSVPKASASLGCLDTYGNALDSTADGDSYRVLLGDMGSRLDVGERLAI